MTRRPLRLLLIAAHPADCFDQAGGTLAHHIEQGDEVTVLTVTLGTRSHHWGLIDAQRQAGVDMDVEAEQARAREEKLAELRGACAILGITEVEHLDLADDDELVSDHMIQPIAEVIRKRRPDIVITHHPYEDGGLKLHASVGRATMFAFRTAMGSGRNSSLPAHFAPSIYFMNPTAYVGVALTNAFIARIDVYVDITDVIEKKVHALDFISSQYYGGSFARKRAEAEDGHHGYNANTSYAEAFQRYMPLVCHTLPVSDFELVRSEASSAQRIAWRSNVIAGRMPLPEGQNDTGQMVDPELYNI